MKFKIRLSKRVMILFAIIILVSIWLYQLFTASPDPKFDYVAMYNEANKPENYEESQNAWPVYEQAISAAAEIPNDVINIFYRPSKKLTDEQVAEIEKNLAANKRSLDLMRQAGNLPFYYIERVRSGNDSGTIAESMYFILIPELSGLKTLAKTMALDCQYSIYQGNIDQALSDMLCMDRLARQMQKESKLLIDQLLGNTIMQLWVNQGFPLAGRADLSDQQRMRFCKIVDQAVGNVYIMSLEAERQSFKDVIQRVFVGSGNGNGKLAWKCRWKLLLEGTDYCSLATWKRECKFFLTCVFGSTQKEVEGEFDRWFELSSKVRLMTPWQYAKDTTGIRRDMEDIISRITSVCLQDYFPNTEAFVLSYMGKANVLALQAVLAIKEFQLAQNRLPQSLAELVEKQYLKEVPLDPFSDGELVYEVDGDSYMLYSWGYDLKDDGGNRDDDFVFWPLPEPEPQQADIYTDVESEPEDELERQGGLPR